MPTSKKQPTRRAAKKAPAANKAQQNKAAVRRRQVEAGVLAGKTEEQIAAEIGVSRGRVSQIKSEADFQARILAICEAATGLTANEVIGTLVAHMRGNLGDFLTSDGRLDLETIERGDLGHLIKTISVKRYDGDVLPCEVVRLELYSAQAAAIQLSKILGIEQQARQNQHDAIKRQRILRAINLLKTKYELTEKDARTLYLSVAPEHGKFLKPEDMK